MVTKAFVRQEPTRFNTEFARVVAEPCDLDLGFRTLKQRLRDEDVIKCEALTVPQIRTLPGRQQR